MLCALPRVNDVATGIALMLLGTGLAQAAGLAITSGSVTGSLVADAEANGQLLSNSASLAAINAEINRRFTI